MEAALKTLPELNQCIEIPGQQIEAFQRDGHTLVRNVLHPVEVEAYREVIVNAASRFNTERRKIEDRDTYGKAFLQIMNLWRVDNDVQKFTLSKRFGKIAADLLGVNNVRIYHDQALFKEPGGGPTPWHQDQYYWPVDTHNTVTMWMPLVNISEEMGMLTFASGSHKKGYVFDNEISDESNHAFNDYVEENNFPVSRPAYLNAGDATWHYGYTIHNAPSNSSQVMREVMTVIYVADGARVTEPKNKWQVNDLNTWMPGLTVGSLVASDLNPLVL